MSDPGGRPIATAEEKLRDDVKDALLIERFLRIPAFANYRNQTYSREDMMACVLGYVLTGSNTKASRISGVGLSQVKQWRYYSKWWDEAVEVAREVMSEKMEDKFTALLNESLNQLEERLKKGDKVIRAEKERRLPIKAAELVRIVNTLFDKRQLLRGDVTSRSESRSGSDEDKLKKLKEAAEQVVRDAENRVEAK